MPLLRCLHASRFLFRHPGPLSRMRSPAPLRFRPLAVRLRRTRPGRDPRGEIRPRGRARRCPGGEVAGSRPEQVVGPIHGRFPAGHSPRPDPSGEIFPAGIQPARAHGNGPLARHRVAVLAANPPQGCRKHPAGGPAPRGPRGKRPGRIHGSFGNPGTSLRASARRRLHIRRHCEGLCPRLENRGGGAYSSPDGGPHRPLILPSPETR